MSYLGFYDPDRTTPASAKLREALARYEARRFRRPATHCLTSVKDAEDIGAAADGLVVRGVNYVPRHTYYVGVPEEATDARS